MGVEAQDRPHHPGLSDALSPLLKEILAKYVTGNRYGGPPEDRHVEEFELGRLATASRPRVAPADSGTFLIPQLQRIILERLGDRPIPTTADEWRELVNEDTVREASGMPTSTRSAPGPLEQ